MEGDGRCVVAMMFALSATDISVASDSVFLYMLSELMFLQEPITLYKLAGSCLTLGGREIEIFGNPSNGTVVQNYILNMFEQKLN